MRITTLCTAINLSAFVALLCLFMPKMYIILLEPEKNVRKLHMSSQGYNSTVVTNTHVDTSKHSHRRHQHARRYK